MFVPDKLERDTYVLVAHNYMVCYYISNQNKVNFVFRLHNTRMEYHTTWIKFVFKTGMNSFQNDLCRNETLSLSFSKHIQSNKVMEMGQTHFKIKVFCEYPLKEPYRFICKFLPHKQYARSRRSTVHRATMQSIRGSLYVLIIGTQPIDQSKQSHWGTTRSQALMA